MLTRIKGCHIYFIRSITLALLLLYFLLTFVYVAPPNPLRDTMAPMLDITIGTYFPQDWNLFAPVPRTADLALLVRPLTNDEFKTIRTRGLPSNGWYNISAPLWVQFQNNRFSAYNKLGRPADQAIVHYLNQPEQQSVQLMVRIASAFCKDIGQSQASFIALTIYERQSKPWAERGTEKARVINTVFVGVYPVDRTVGKMHLYQIGGKE